MAAGPTLEEVRLSLLAALEEDGVRWFRGPLAKMFACLADPMCYADLAEWLHQQAAPAIET